MLYKTENMQISCHQTYFSSGFIIHFARACCTSLLES